MADKTRRPGETSQEPRRISLAEAKGADARLRPRQEKSQDEALDKTRELRRVTLPRAPRTAQDKTDRSEARAGAQIEPKRQATAERTSQAPVERKGQGRAERQAQGKSDSGPSRPVPKSNRESHRAPQGGQAASLSPRTGAEASAEGWRLPAIKLKRSQLILAALVTLLILILLFSFLPTFRVQEFSSTPLRLVSEQRLLEASGLKTGQHFLSGLLQKNVARMLRGRYSGAEAQILQKIPQIRDVEVRLQSPRRIFFRVLERLPIAAIQIPDGMILMDRDGLAIQLRDALPNGVPLIAGLNVTRAVIGEKLEIDLPRDLQRALSILSALVEADAQASGELQLMPLLQEVRPSANQRVLIKLRLPANGKTLNLSCAQNDYLTKHFVWLRSVIATGVFDDRVPGTLDLSGRYQIFKPLDPERETEVYQWGQDLPIEPVAPPVVEESVWEEPIEAPEGGWEDFATP